MKENAEVANTKCAHCGKKVALLSYRGHTTLIEAKITADGPLKLVMYRHACTPPPARDGNTTAAGGTPPKPETRRR